MKKGRPKSNITESNQYVWLRMVQIRFRLGNNPNYAFAVLVN